MAVSSVAEPVIAPAAHRVVAKRQETHDTWTLELEPEDGGLGEFAPGQFAMLYAFGVGEVPISISAGQHVHTIRAVGPVTSTLCGLEAGDYIGARGPYGTAWPIEAAEGRDIVVVAGGIGLAPLRPVVHHVLAHRESYGKVTVAYGARGPAELLFGDEVAQWRSRFDVDVAVTVDSAGEDWRGHVGVVTTLLPRAEFDPARTTAFVCGPEVMMRFAASALLDLGVPSEAIHVSMERSMKCAVGHCGHCQLRELFICRDGAVLDYTRARELMRVRAL